MCPYAASGTGATDAVATESSERITVDKISQWSYLVNIGVTGVVYEHRFIESIPAATPITAQI